ncbi:helix-turn-helix domain-containing protein [Phycicoccus sp. SLBN-51]|uniref:helix-turn-helix transcriptional regulator n=1 Tax=Phycicoccus sp. SLBN-51 TaxID=2768447 RepID=UPI00115299CF|nr:helix-turn-helix domain-containing protein [Phycicoccus sp. SLBN-51]TQJ52226.1 AlpA family transcriptional regulator [Phycicoccus sp. SLBN-51]
MRVQKHIEEPQPLSTCDRLWTIDDVSAFLGVPVQTLYQWRHRSEGPPGVRLGKHLRFDPAQVRAWVASKVA